MLCYVLHALRTLLGGATAATAAEAKCRAEARSDTNAKRVHSKTPRRDLRDWASLSPPYCGMPQSLAKHRNTVGRLGTRSARTRRAGPAYRQPRAIRRLERRKGHRQVTCRRRGGCRRGGPQQVRECTGERKRKAGGPFDELAKSCTVARSKVSLSLRGGELWAWSSPIRPFWQTRQTQNRGSKNGLLSEHRRPFESPGLPEAAPGLGTRLRWKFCSY